MSDRQATTVTVLTPPGRGAVATVSIRGPDCVRAADFFFRSPGRPLAERRLNQIAYGRWRESTGEEVVACRTDEDSVEIHCHGGEAAVAAIVDDLVQQGCQRRTWQESLAAAECDPIRAAAQLALPSAPTLRTASILLDQCHGALSEAFEQIVARLDVSDVSSAVAQFDALLATAPLGRHLVRPWRVVLAGRPNVGKSSLLNALLGYQRSIVFDLPGTTRDVVSSQTALDGWPVELSDTAGLHDTLDALEAEGIARARARLADADLVLLVIDATAPDAAATRLLPEWPDALPVFNKCDLAPAVNPESGTRVSALTGQGIRDLFEAIVARLVPREPSPGAAVVFLADLEQALTEAREAVLRQDFTVARQKLADWLPPHNPR